MTGRDWTGVPAVRRIEEAARERRRSLDEASDWTDVLQVAVAEAVEEGMSEKRAADLAGVTRMTIRAWLGKDK